MDTGHGCDLAFKHSLRLFDLTDGVGEERRCHLDLDGHSVEVLCTIEIDHVVRLDLTVRKKNSFDLRREYVYAADDHHVIGTSGYLLDLRGGTSAFALTVVKACQVVSVIAQKRYAFLGDGREYEFTEFSVRKRLACLRIHDLRNEVVCFDVDQVGLVAGTSYTRSADLRKTIDIKCTKTEFFFDLISHLDRPCLCAEDTAAQVQLTLVDACCFELVGNMKRICRRAHQDFRLPLTEDRDLSCRVTTGYRDRCRTEFCTSKVRTKTSGEETVTIRNVYEVALLYTGSCHRTAENGVPKFDVICCITYDLHLSGRTGRCMYTDQFRSRNRQCSERIVISEIEFISEREFRKIRDALDVAGLYTLFFHALSVVRYMFPHAVDALDQALTLHLCALVVRHALGFRIVDPGVHFSSHFTYLPFASLTATKSPIAVYPTAMGRNILSRGTTHFRAFPY